MPHTNVPPPSRPSETSWSWVPLACLMLAALGQSLGTGPIPWILSPEYFPTAIRSQVGGHLVLVGVSWLSEGMGVYIHAPVRVYR